MYEEPELEEYTEAQPQKKVRPIIIFWRKIGGGSLTIAALLHLAILVIGLFWVLRILHDPVPPVDFLPGGSGGGGGERGATYKMESKKRAAITPTSKAKRVFAEGATSSFSIPDPGDSFGEISTLSTLTGAGASGGLGGSGSGGGFGSGKGSGVGAGTGSGFGGTGMGKLFGLIPETMRKRCSKDDRLQRLHDNGGTPACEEAVLKSLRWLKSTQQSDGSWGGGNKQAMTGLALLAFFGHCETPVSDEFGETTAKGITYLVNFGMQQEGHLSSQMDQKEGVYEHAIGTYALGEAYTFCKELKYNVPGLQEVTQKAGQFIIDNQNKNGGWAYKYEIGDKAHVDTSTTGWQVQALKACKHTKLEYRGMSNCIQKALTYLRDKQEPGGGFGYLDKNPVTGHETKGYYSLTGVGVLCNQMWDKGGSLEVIKGCSYIVKNTKFNYNGPESDLYCHYYESQAMMQKGGKEWIAYNNIFRDQVLNNQNEDGSWKPPGGGGPIFAVEANRLTSDAHYRTCLCTLMLEVYYRFLNSTGTGARSSRLDDV
jgi:hypothetical protein